MTRRTRDLLLVAALAALALAGVMIAFRAHADAYIFSPDADPDATTLNYWCVKGPFEACNEILIRDTERVMKGWQCQPGEPIKLSDVARLFLQSMRARPDLAGEKAELVVRIAIESLNPCSG